MNKILSFVGLVVFTFVINALQSSLLLTSGHYIPDLNLILVVCLSFNRSLILGILVVILNGHLMDTASGYVIGVNTLSRLTLFFIIRKTRHYFELTNTSLFVLFLVSTIYVWLFVKLMNIGGLADGFGVSVETVLGQVFINSLVGILAFKLFSRVNAKI